MQENKALIDYFGEPSFDAESYARKLFEHEPIEVSLKKVRELEALKKGTEDVSNNLQCEGGVCYNSCFRKRNGRLMVLTLGIINHCCRVYSFH